MRHIFNLTIAAVLGGAIALGGTVSSTYAQSVANQAKFPVELNRLEQDGAACRVYLVAQNPTDAKITSFKLDLVFFDQKEIIRNRLYVELGPLIAKKTAVRLFDIPETQCSALGSILLNDIVACQRADGQALECLQRLKLSSKAAIALRF